MPVNLQLLLKFLKLKLKKKIEFEFLKFQIVCIGDWISQAVKPDSKYYLNINSIINNNNSYKIRNTNE